MADMTRPVLRIFLASPHADTRPARAKVAEVVREVMANQAIAERADLRLLRWDDPDGRTLFDAGHNPQGDVIVQKGHPAECDLFIGIFCHTPGGSQLSEAQYGRSPLDRLWYATEWELAQALDSRRAGRVHTVWVWRDSRDAKRSPHDTPEEKKAVNRATEAVDDLLEHHLNPPGEPARSQKPMGFENEEDLAKQLRTNGLANWVSRFLDERYPVSAQRAEGAAATHSAASGPPPDPRTAELHYLQTLIHDKQLAQHEERYQPLAGQQRRSASFERSHQNVPLEVSSWLQRFGQRVEDDNAPPTPFADVLDAYRALPAARHRRLAVLGEPGAGKSFSLQRLTLELCHAAMKDPQAPLPVLVSLGDWLAADQGLESLVRGCLSRFDAMPGAAGGLAHRFDTLRDTGRLTLLLDGLNEIPTDQRAAKAAELKRWVQDERFRAVIVSCRERDFRDDYELPFDRLTLQPLTPMQVYDFIHRAYALQYADSTEVGRIKAEQRFWQMAGGDHLCEVWATWRTAGATWEQFFTADDVPRENPDVSGATTAEEDVWWRHMRQDTRSLLRLAANPYLLFMMTVLQELPANRAELFDGFLRELYQRERKARMQRLDAAQVPDLESWLATMAELAAALQGRRPEPVSAESHEGEESDADDDAAEPGVSTSLPQAEWPASLTQQVLNFSIDASVLQLGDGSVRFTHQLLQEALAARVLLQACRSGNTPASRFWPPPQWWQRSGWEVALELAFESLGDDAAGDEQLMSWVGRDQPELASQLWVAYQMPQMPAALAAIGAHWLPRMTDVVAAPDARERAAIGRALGRFGLDRRPGVGLRADGLPDIDWVRIETPREFVYQDGRHAPIPPFELARFPITNLQYQAFIKDRGYEDDRWWQGLPGRIEVRNPSWDEPNSPRETVSWLEAKAFCRWLSARESERTGQPVRIDLPTEVQWERAARGLDGRKYPWGEGYRAGWANCNEILGDVKDGVYLERTSAVGIYPVDATDMPAELAGNVWEWVDDKRDANDADARASRVLRGGSWGDYPRYLRADVRGGDRPGDRNYLIGFRVCRVSPI